MTKNFDRTSLEALLLKRFFYAPSFGPYGGVAGLYDYGPAGCALQSNILNIWKQHFVMEENMLELDCTMLTPYDVLKTSGHVDKFADYMVKDTKNGEIFRADHLVKNVLKKRLEDDELLKNGKAPTQAKGKGKNKKAAPTPLSDELRKEYEDILEQLDNYDGKGLDGLIKKYNITSPEAGNPVSECTLFNLMFETQIGPTGSLKGFLRPETAQGQFLNFKRRLEYNTGSMPFASAQIGKSFRNEISPRQGLLRVREFTMAEIEHFVDPENKNHHRFDEVKDIEIVFYPASNQMEGKGTVTTTIGKAVESGMVNNQTLGYFIARIYLFLIKIGIKHEKLRFRQHMANEMAHYACDCWDAEIENSYGWIECVGCADRSAFDLTVHQKKTGEKLVVQEALPEPIIRDRWVIEINKPKFGPAFKKNVRFVQGYFDNMLEDPTISYPKTTKDSEKLWNEEKVLEFKKKLEEGNGSCNITCSDGNEYTVTSDMVAINKITEKINVREYTPNVIEPSFGIGRIFYSLIEHSYWVREGDEQRAVLSFPACVAPIKCLLTPISHQDEFVPVLKDIAAKLRAHNISNRVDDSSNTIGRRYARNDELGIPFAITLDFQTTKDQTVTLRERDSTMQIRDTIDTVVDLVYKLVQGKMEWKDVLANHKAFTTQEV
jgi:glycyl-tRNA synthetase